MTPLPDIAGDKSMAFHMPEILLDKETPDFVRFMARSSALLLLRDYPPAWSPFATQKELPGALATIFPAAYFAEFIIKPPSPTQMRRLHSHIAKARMRNSAPEWLPEGDFKPREVAHLYALATSIGAHALIDLNDLIGQDRKLLDAIGNKALDHRDTYHPHSKKIMGYALDGACGFVDGPSFGNFFIAFADPDAMSTPFGHALFDYIVDGVGSDVLQSAARRLLKSDWPYFSRAARRFLHIPDPAPADDLTAGGEPHEQAAVAPAAEPSFNPLARPTAEPSPAPKWIPPVAPEGVILTQRALRELRSERNWPAEKLEAALNALAAYRAMKLGTLSLAAYNEQLAAARLADHLCFADAGTLKAFASDYSVTHNGRKFTLDRHIKWGRGSTPITCLRVYYTWDSERAEIIVGSMPRHLPTKRS